MILLNTYRNNNLFFLPLFITLLLIFFIGCNRENKESEPVIYYATAPFRPVHANDVKTSINLTYESLRFWHKGDKKGAFNLQSKAADLVAEGGKTAIHTCLSPFTTETFEADIKLIEAKEYLKKQEVSLATKNAYEAWGIIQPCLFNTLREIKFIEILNEHRDPLNFSSLERKINVEKVAELLMSIAVIFNRIELDEQAKMLNEIYNELSEPKP